MGCYWTTGKVTTARTTKASELLGESPIQLHSFGLTSSGLKTLRVGWLRFATVYSSPEANTPPPAQTSNTKQTREGRGSWNWAWPGGGWRSQWDTTSKLDEVVASVLGSSSFPDPDWPDLSNEISPGHCIAPMLLVWSWPDLCGCINWQRHTPTHQDGSHFEPHLPVDMRLATPSLLSVLRSSIPVASSLHLSALGIFAIPRPALCFPSPQ